MKNKLNKYFLVIITAFALLFSSCSDFFGSDSKEDEVATIRISLDENARTALPSFEKTEEVKKFKLIYQKGSESALTESWESETTEGGKTAYELMTADNSIMVEQGTSYSFTLKAYFDSEEGSGCYSGSTIDAEGNILHSIEMHFGANEIRFKLSLAELDPAITGKGNLSLTVKDSGNSLKKIEAIVYKRDDSVFVEQTADNKTGSNAISFTAGEAGTKIEWADLDVGYYKILLKFYDANGVQTGYNVQYATIVKGGTSRNIEEIDAKDSKNKVYEITYAEKGKDYVNEANEISWNLPDTATSYGTYSRFSNITLPVAVAVDNLFLGWYSDGTKITKIDNGTKAENLSLTPKFISKKEMPELTSVEITDSTGGSAKVGDKLTANLKAGTETFEGSVSYEWYRGNEEISGATSKEYVLTKDDVTNGEGNNKISVKVTQKYTVTEESTGLYSVSEIPRTVEPTSSVTVTTGTLSGTISDSLKYNDGTSVLIDDDLSLTNQTATLTDQAGNQITVNLNFATGAKAPSTSGYMNLIASADGYDNKELSNAIFVTVKANPPSTSGLLSTDKPNIPKGSIAFTAENPTLEYTTPGGVETAPGTDSTWSNITTTAFTQPGALWVRVKEIAGTADDTGNKVGFVEKSEPAQVTIAAENQGTLVIINGVSFGDTALKFGNTITATVSYTEVNHTHDVSVDGTLSYKWFYGSGDTWTEISGATGSSYTIGTTDAIGKNLKVEVNQAHPNGKNYPVSNSTSGTVEKGTLTSSGTLTYSVTAVLGGTLDATKLGGLTYTNQAGTSVSASLSFENTTVPSGASSVSVKASRAGYNDLSLSVSISVMSPVPSGVETYLSTSQGDIPLGYLKFTDTAANAHLQYSTAATAPTENSGWTDAATGTEIQKPDHLYLRIKSYGGTAGTILASAASADLAGSLTDYVGTRSVVIKDVAAQTPAITFDNNDVTLTASGKTLTANVPTGVTISDWEIPGEELTDENAIATVSSDKTSLTFKDSAPAGVYQVILWASRESNTLSAIYSVKIGSGN
ncbi:hypothetical protein DYE50_01165 [Treponema ruminis]|uniref:Uncharacterized protein n=1 Tax=Treponema ruminis TaxID=744515 RepID=A0A7W8GBA1_9SPIR|nr:hypothetical protein [Treponema ruminis]MBB5227293.1 hypothetical protein [Treponema ruminis]QSI01193.1 hypothetical protein DYE50_01165 [Treponema ruminis]